MKKFSVLFMVVLFAIGICSCTQKEGIMTVDAYITGISDDEILYRSAVTETASSTRVKNISQHKMVLMERMRDQKVVTITFRIVQNATGFQSFYIQEIK